MRENNAIDSRPMPDTVRELYDALWQEVVYLNAKWKVYKQLFGVNDDRIDLLNNTAPAFFQLVQDVLRDNVFMCICRLTDPKKVRGKETLSFERLLEHLKATDEDSLFVKVEPQLRDMNKEAASIREWRNQIGAHNALHTALQFHSEPLPGITRKMVEDAIRFGGNMLNTVLLHFDGGTTDFENPIQMGDGETILSLLKEAQAHRLCSRRLDQVAATTRR